jgi:phage FluMu protein Com
MIDIYCRGTKKKLGIPCRRYLGRVEGKAELLCPICKTLNVIDGAHIAVKEKD